MTLVARREIKFEPLSTGGPISNDYMRRMQTVLADHLRKIYDSLTGTSIELSLTSSIYLGDPDTNGTWRIRINGNDLVFERLESGTWNEKMAAVA